MAESSRISDRIFAVAVAALVVVALVLIGNVQANQYRDVVDRIDGNTKAIVCILRVSPEDRDRHSIRACLRPAGL